MFRRRRNDFEFKPKRVILKAQTDINQDEGKSDNVLRAAGCSRDREFKFTVRDFTTMFYTCPNGITSVVSKSRNSASGGIDETVWLYVNEPGFLKEPVLPERIDAVLSGVRLYLNKGDLQMQGQLNTDELTVDSVQGMFDAFSQVKESVRKMNTIEARDLLEQIKDLKITIINDLQSQGNKNMSRDWKNLSAIPSIKNDFDILSRKINEFKTNFNISVIDIDSGAPAPAPKHSSPAGLIQNFLNLK